MQCIMCLLFSKFQKHIDVDEKSDFKSFSFFLVTRSGSFMCISFEEFGQHFVLHSLVYFLCRCWFVCGQVFGASWSGPDGE